MDCYTLPQMLSYNRALLAFFSCIPASVFLIPSLCFVLPVQQAVMLLSSMWIAVGVKVEVMWPYPAVVHDLQ
jgi:hypothetical protein